MLKLSLSYIIEYNFKDEELFNVTHFLLLLKYAKVNLV